MPMRRQLFSWLLISITLCFGACSSTKKNAAPPKSDDLLELLTGFGEAISQRNFEKAISYLTEEEQNLIKGPTGVLNDQMQNRLAAVPLQRLIKNPSVRVEGGRLTGIYESLPLLRQGETDTSAFADTDSDIPAIEDESDTNTVDPHLKEMVKHFYSALNNKSFIEALSLIHEDERKIFVNDQGQLTEDSKRRLSRVSPKDRRALTLRDGKLTGLTLIVPAD